jgi:hypothetical protein
MYTSLVLVALAGLPAVGQAEESDVRWQKDYLKACERAQSQGKPIAVFFGTEPEGASQVARDGQLSAEVTHLLSLSYVPVYLDSKSEAGRKWAQQFEVPGGVGLVISDQACTVQAFHHAGRLANADLARTLRRFAESGREVRTTESIQTQRVSYYQPAAAQPAYQPAYPPMPVYYGGYGGGYSGGYYGGFGGYGGGFGGGFGGGGGGC